MGGQGIVYRAHDTRLDIPVALKVPKETFARHPTVHEEFIREAQIGAQIGVQAKHPSICRIYACEFFDDIPHLVMEYVPGETLSSFSKVGWMAPGPKEAVEVVEQLARALAAFHACDFSPLHRDIKPGNVRLTRERKPVLIDFGLALRLNSRTDLQVPSGRPVGTLLYMSPEQMLPGRAPIGPASDVYSLGAILYELLTGRPPLEFKDPSDAIDKILGEEPKPPSQKKRKVSQSLDQICLKALAKEPRNRYQSMQEFAEALHGADFSPSGGTNVKQTRPPLKRDSIRFAFAGYGEIAPADLEGQNRLFLDVGNDLRPGVIDHHQTVGAGATARLVAQRTDLIDAAVAPGGADDFTIVLHQAPDLDCVVSAYLAIEYLTTRTLPKDIDELCAYVDRADAGHPVMWDESPFTLYAAQQHILARVAQSGDWQRAVKEGLTLVDYVLKTSMARKASVDSVDAFDCPGLFSQDDRDAVTEDANRYVHKLNDSRTNARVARLRLPAQFGPDKEVDALLVRDVQNATDPQRVQYFKIWARGDTKRSANGQGFQALSVYSHLDGTNPPRCILSVTPGSQASLRGLGQELDKAEELARIKKHKFDDRKVDPVTGKMTEFRAGYNNADPWYDGRSHSFTIIDSPRRGTVLSADEIEQIFLDFGKAQARPL